MSVRDDADVVSLKLDRQLGYIRDHESLIRFECRTPKCHFATNNSNKLFQHEQGCKSETDIICKQVPMHRPCDKIRNELVAEGILPDYSWHNWEFATFDCECLMDEVGDEFARGVKFIHRLTSIAIKTSFGEPGEYYLERKDMDPWSVKTLVQDFLLTLVQIRRDMFDKLPQSVIDGRTRYFNITKSKDFKKRPVERQANAWKKLRFLDNCLALRIYSWNGERYDHNVLWAPLLDVLAGMGETFKRFTIIRRGSGIMQFTDGALIFRDFLNMTSPMKIEKFAQSCGITDVSKTTFPYEYYRNIESLRTATAFPSYRVFRSSLCQDKSRFATELETLVSENIRTGKWPDSAEASKVFGFEPPITFTSDDGNYTICQADRRHALELLHTSPKKFFESKEIFDKNCSTMADYLKNYNLNDVILLVRCIKAYAAGFFRSWQVNIHEQMSLPGVAQNLAFRYYEEKETAIYTFGKNFKNYNDQIRKQLHGGMTLV